MQLPLQPSTCWHADCPLLKAEGAPATNSPSNGPTQCSGHTQPAAAVFGNDESMTGVRDPAGQAAAFELADMLLGLQIAQHESHQLQGMSVDDAAVQLATLAQPGSDSGASTVEEGTSAMDGVQHDAADADMTHDVADANMTHDAADADMADAAVGVPAAAPVWAGQAQQTLATASFALRSQRPPSDAAMLMVPTPAIGNGSADVQQVEMQTGYLPMATPAAAGYQAFPDSSRASASMATVFSSHAPAAPVPVAETASQQQGVEAECTNFFNADSFDAATSQAAQSSPGHHVDVATASFTQQTSPGSQPHLSAIGAAAGVPASGLFAAMQTAVPSSTAAAVHVAPAAFVPEPAATSPASTAPFGSPVAHSPEAPSSTPMRGAARGSASSVAPDAGMSTTAACLSCTLCMDF